MSKRRIILAVLLLAGIGFMAWWMMASERAPRAPDRPAAAVTEAQAPATVQAPAVVPAAPAAKPEDVTAKLLATAKTVEVRESPANAQGERTRERVVRVDMKYPLLRVRETVGTDATTGRESVRDRTVAVADHIMVKLRPGATTADLEQINAKYGARIRKQMHAPGMYLVELARPDLDALERAVADYNRETATVAYSEPDYVVSANETIPNDPSFSLLYGMRNTGQTGGTPDADIDASDAWDSGTGSTSILVGVIDTGIDYNHQDLAANMWTNPGESGLSGVGQDKRSNGIDDDNNGFIDDWHGWDFVSEDNNPMDDHFHGTHCSGTIGGVGNNGIGVAGVNWRVSLVGLKFLSSSGSGYISDAVDATYYGTKINVKLTSNSWGGGGYSQGMVDAITDAGLHNILFVAAAGNNGSNNDSSPHYPSSYANANLVAVAATDHNDAKASFSNYGLTSVDLGAPGVSIYSTLLGNTYGNLSGTSMATPHVAGALALILSLNPGVSYAEIKQALLDGVDVVASMTGTTVSGGRLNVAKTLARLGLRVAGSTPAAGAVVFVPPTNIVVDFSDAYTPSSVQATDLTVNGIAATGFSLTDSNTVTFLYGTSPVTTQGLQTMNMTTNVMTRLSDSSGLKAWTAAFRYDAVALQVVTSEPPNGATVAIPLTTFRVHLNEPVAAASVGAGDLVVDQGSVTAFSVLDADTIEFTLTNVNRDAMLNLSIAAGTLTDTNGNPNALYAGTLSMDAVTSAIPVPLVARLPKGGMIYDQSVTGRISYAGDGDTFEVAVDDGNTITVVARPLSSWQPAVALVAPSGSTMTNATTGPGAAAIAQSMPGTGSGTYRVVVSGQGVSTGAYVVQVMLNAAAERESFGGASNDTLGTAQSIEGSFLSLVANADRGAVMGDSAGSGDWFSFSLPAGRANTLVLSPQAGSSLALSLHDGSGAQLALATGGAFNVGARISNYMPPSNGVYFAHVTGTGAYSLVVTRRATFDQEPNDTSSQAQPLAGSGVALGYSSPQLDEGLALYYSFSTNAGAVVLDDSGHGRTGTVAGATFTTNGYRGAAYNFDGNDRINIDNGTFVEGQYALSFGAWIRPTNSQLGGIIGKTDSGNSVILLNLGTPDNVAGGVSRTDNSGLFFSDFSHLQIGQWQHVMVTYDGTQARLYHNGSLVQTTAVASLLPTRSSAVGLAVGDSSSSRGWFFRGLIDEVRIYQRALSAEEVLTLYGQDGAGGDRYAYTAQQGEQLFISTRTPSDGASEFVNALDPALQLYDPSGVLVASDTNGAADQRNALITYTTATAGTYSIQVQATNSAGEYILSLNIRPLAVVLPAHVTEGNGTLAGAGRVNIGEVAASNLTFALSSEDISEITLPASVVILAGQTSATFDVTVQDDLLLDGSQTAGIIASNESFTAGSTTTIVDDDESSTLDVTLPASGTEGDGLLGTPGRVNAAAAVDADIVVTLVSDDTTEAVVPATVTILSGQTSAVFTVTVVDDNLIDGPQGVTVTATVTNWTLDGTGMTVFDDEDTALRLTVPASAVEGDGTLTGTGRVAISGFLSSNLTVALLSSDTTEVTVPASTVILAGQTSATFDVTVVNDTAEDGVQTSTVSVAATGFLSASNAIAIADDDVNTFAWSIISSPQPRSFGIPLIITAKTIDGVTARGFTGVVALTASGDGGPLVISPTNSGVFAAGVWSGTIAVQTPDSNAVLSANDGAGHTGLSNPFLVQTAQGDFTNITAALAALSDATVAWGDYDNDGDLDLLLSGSTGTSLVTRIYRTDISRITSVSSNNLALYYSFSTNGGATAQDDTGNGHTGTVSGATYVTNGYSGSAYSFDGGDRITVLNGGFVNGQTNITFGAWIRPTNSQLGGVIGKTDSGNASILLNLGMPDNISIDVNRTNGTSLGINDFAHLTTTGAWQHVMATYDGTQTLFYYNGVLVGSTNSAAVAMPTRSNSISLAVGDSSGTRGWFFKGQIDEVRVYQRTLSSNEIRSLYIGTDTITTVTFADSGNSLPGISGGAATWGDFDNDNDLDILLSGATSSGSLTRIFRNDSGAFVDSAIPFEGLSNSAAAWGDYDNDGDLDILLAGMTATSRVTRIYRNERVAQPINVSTSGLALYYSFAANGGSTVQDDSGNGHTGTVSGATYLTNGYSGGAYTFDGNDRINVFNGSFVHGQTSFTFGAWIRPTNSQLSGIIGKTESGNASVLLNLGTPDNISVDINRTNGGSVGISDFAHLVITGKWQHVMATYDGTQVRFYYNGALVNTSTVAVAMPIRSNSVGLAVGDSSSARGWYFRGQIDEVRMYQRTLASNEVSALYSGATTTNVIVFTEAGAGLPGLSGSAVAWGDYDRDGDLDVLLAGQSATARVAGIWRNQGGGVFQPAVTLPDAVSDSAAAWGDYDSDGDLDIVIAGDNGTAPIARVLRNNGAGAYSDSGVSLPGVKQGSAAWGDFDNDGDLDLLLMGLQQDATPLLRCYRNNGTNTFDDTGTFGIGISRGAGAWADYDNDGDLDMVVSGLSPVPSTLLFRNQSIVTNHVPSAPLGLGAVVSSNSAVLKWQASTDTETPVAALGYNIRVGKSAGASDVATPMAQNGDGYRKRAADAHIHNATNWNLAGLTPGPHYVAVQAVDGAMAGSPFSTSMTFTIADQLSVVLPALATEGVGILTNAGRVTATVPAFTNVVVLLVSSDTTEVSLATSVLLPIGATSVFFNVTVLDDAIADGAQTVQVTAAAFDYVNGSNSIVVADNELHHFGWGPISTPQSRGGAFPVMVTAESIDDQVLAGFTSQVYLSCSTIDGPVSIAPTISGPFQQGTWTGSVSVGSIEINAMMSADLGPTTGQSDLFDVIGPIISVSPQQITNLVVTVGQTTNAEVHIDNLGIGILSYTARAEQAICVCSNLSLYYNFNSATGSVADDTSGNALHGTVVGATFTLAGYEGGALSFDGTNDYVQAPDSPVLRTSRVSVSVWVMPGHTYTNGSADFFSKEQPGFPAGYKLNYSAGSLNFTISETGVYHAVAVGYTLQSNQWYHLVGTYDGQWQRLYVNGALAGESNLAIQIRQTTTQPRIGATTDASPANFLHGKLDDVRFYGRGLSSNEVLDLYIGNLPVSWVVIQPPLSGDILPGAGNDLTLTFTATGLTAGTRAEAMLIVASDDLSTPSYAVPLGMTVRPDIPVIQAEPVFTLGFSNGISWLSALGADSYWAESALATNSAPDSTSGWIPSTAHTFTGLLDGTLYFYHVRAGASGTAGQVSGEWSDWTSSRQLFSDGDWDNDFMPNGWEDGRGLNPLAPGDAQGDLDGDGADNRSEYIADTDPTNGTSYLRLLEPYFNATNLTVQWQGGTGVIQYLEHAPQLDGAWDPLYTNMPPTPTTNSVAIPGNGSERFLRIRTVR